VAPAVAPSPAAVVAECERASTTNCCSEEEEEEWEGGKKAPFPSLLSSLPSVSSPSDLTPSL